MITLQRIYLTKVCKGYDLNGREFSPLQNCLYDETKKRWYTENHTIEQLTSIFKDCIISSPGGDMEYCANIRKNWKDDYLVIIYNNYVEWG